MKYTEMELSRAYECARDTFNSLPLETRKKSSSPIDRISENEIAIKIAEKYLMELKKRRTELNDWLIEWYRENNTDTINYNEK